MAHCIWNNHLEQSPGTQQQQQQQQHLIQARKDPTTSHRTAAKKAQIPNYRIFLFLSVHLMLFYTMSAANKKEGKMELRGETLLNHYISMVRWGGVDGG